MSRENRKGEKETNQQILGNSKKNTIELGKEESESRLKQDGKTGGVRMVLNSRGGSHYQK